MNPVLKLLLEGGSLTAAQMAQVAGLAEAEVEQHLEQLKKDRIFLGWRPVLDLSRESAAEVAVEALIEVRISPERDGDLTGSPSASADSTRCTPVCWSPGAMTCW